jgi:hypothetical protein
MSCSILKGENNQARHADIAALHGNNLGCGEVRQQLHINTINSKSGNQSQASSPKVESQEGSEEDQKTLASVELVTTSNANEHHPCLAYNVIVSSALTLPLLAPELLPKWRADTVNLKWY